MLVYPALVVQFLFDFRLLEDIGKLHGARFFSRTIWNIHPSATPHPQRSLTPFAKDALQKHGALPWKEISCAVLALLVVHSPLDHLTHFLFWSVPSGWAIATTRTRKTGPPSVWFD